MLNNDSECIWKALTLLRKVSHTDFLHCSDLLHLSPQTICLLGPPFLFEAFINPTELKVDSYSKRCSMRKCPSWHVKSDQQGILSLFMRTAMTQIRLGISAGQFKSLFGEHVKSYIFVTLCSCTALSMTYIITLTLAMLNKLMPRPLLISSQSDYLGFDRNSHI